MLMLVWRCLVLCLCLSTSDLLYADVVVFGFVFGFVNTWTSLCWCCGFWFCVWFRQHLIFFMLMLWFLVLCLVLSTINLLRPDLHHEAHQIKPQFIFQCVMFSTASTDAVNRYERLCFPEVDNEKNILCTEVHIFTRRTWYKCQLSLSSGQGFPRQNICKNINKYSVDIFNS